MRVVGYIRDTSCLPGKKISEESLGEQETQIKSYARGHGFSISQIYCDASGDPDENAAFDQLLKDGMAREFDLVVTDSLFQCGCNLWKAREVLMYTLFPAGIHFAVVEDDFSSVDKSLDEVEAFFKAKHGMFNEHNIKNAMMKRSQEGVLSRNDVKYGYVLGEDGHLEIKEETAAVVRQIYQWFAEGMDLKEIARQLEDKKVLNPNASRGVARKGADPCHWIRSTVKDILSRSVYCGHWSKVVQGQEITFTSPAIVSQELFEKAQDLLNSQARAFRPQKKKHKYSGLIEDKDFGRAVRFREDKEGVSYCTYNTAELAASCEKKKLLTEELDQAVLRALKEEKNRAQKVHMLLEEQGKASFQHYLEGQKEELKRLAEKLVLSEKERMKAYGSWQGGKLSKEEFDKIDASAMRLRSRSNEKFQEAEGKIKERELALSMDNPWMRLFFDYGESEEVTRECLEKYVECIVLKHLSVSEVMVKEKSWFRLLPEEWSV